MTNKDAAWLEKILDSPCLSLKEIDLLIRLDPTEPVYTNIKKRHVSMNTLTLESVGYSVGLFTDLTRSELNGAYVLQVRKKDAD